MAEPAGARRVLGWLGLALAVAVADQFTKALALDHLILHRPVPIVPTLDLMLTYNTGAAFSLLSDAGGWQRWLFIVLALIVSAVLVRWLTVLPPGERWSASALALVLGGALGNLVDRVFRDGKVVDFIYFHVGDFHWPAFNVADSAICVGAVMLVLHALFVPERKSG